MSEPITIEDIYKLFQASQAEADKRAAEADKRAAETARLFAESKAESDKSMNELRQAVKEATRSANQTSKEVAALTTRWGRFVENFVEPGIVALFQSRGIEVFETSTRVKSRKPGLEMEIDILATNGDVAVLVEVKSRLSRDDANEFLAKIPRFKQAFVVYKDFKIYGAVAGIEFDQNVDEYAYQKGLFVIKQSGEAVTIVNDENFKPAIW